MDKLPFRARQMHPAVVMGIEPNGEQAFGLILVAVDIVALTSTGSKINNDNNRGRNYYCTFGTSNACCVCTYVAHCPRLAQPC